MAAWQKRREAKKAANPNLGDLHLPLAIVADAWPSPSATDYKGSAAPGQRRGQLSEQTETTVQSAETASLWATPTARTTDHETAPLADGLPRHLQPRAARDIGAEADRFTEGLWGQTPTGDWPTPTAEEATGYMSGSKRDIWRPTLSGIVQGKSPKLHQGRPSPSGPQAPATSTAGEPSSPCGPTSPPPSRPRRRLNWRFVAWLMGWPAWWVCPEPTPCGRSETELWLNRRRRHLSSLVGDWGHSGSDEEESTHA
jgi:hypothetical protein